MFTQIFAKLFGSKSGREIKKILNIVGQINQIYATLSDLTDEGLKEKTNVNDEFILAAKAGKTGQPLPLSGRRGSRPGSLP